MEEGRIEKLSSQTFGMWKLQLEVLLMQKDLSITLKGKSKKLASMSDEDWDKLDKKKTAKGLWDRLSDMYEMASASNEVFLMKKLYNLKMKDGGNVSNHLNEFKTLINQLISIDIKLEDEIKAILLLCSLLDSWEGVVMAVSNLTFDKKGSVLNFDDVVGIFLSEDVKKKSRNFIGRHFDNRQQTNVVTCLQGNPQ